MSRSGSDEAKRAARGRVALTALLWACLCPAMAAEPTPSGDIRAATQFEQGLQLAHEGDLAGAIVVFARLTREYPRLPEPHAQLAALYVRRGEPLKAIAPLQTALRLDSSAPALQEQLGDLYVVLASEAYAAAQDRPAARAKHAQLRQLTITAPTNNTNTSR